MEKRIFPRVMAQLPVVVANEDGIKFNLFTLDASSEGVRVQCSTDQRNKMTPGGSYIRKGRPIELFLWLDLPSPEGTNNQIEARCNITFSRRVANNICHIGMRYTVIKNDGHEKLMDYIASSAASSNYA